MRSTPASRTLNVEIDVDNPQGQILPGAYAFVHFKLSAARNIPQAESLGHSCRHAALPVRRSACRRGARRCRPGNSRSPLAAIMAARLRSSSGLLAQRQRHFESCRLARQRHSRPRGCFQPLKTCSVRWNRIRDRTKIYKPTSCRKRRSLCCIRLTAPWRAAGQINFAYSSRWKRARARSSSPGASEPRLCSIEET